MLHLSHPRGCALGQPVGQASALVHEGGTCHLKKKARKKEDLSTIAESLMTTSEIICRNFTNKYIQKNTGDQTQNKTGALGSVFH